MASERRPSASPAPDADLSTGVAAGSLRYFAVLFSSPTRRDDLRALYATAAEIERCVHLANHDVAHTRLQWWRQELDRLVAGHAQHPITHGMANWKTINEELYNSAAGKLHDTADFNHALYAQGLAPSPTWWSVDLPLGKVVDQKRAQGLIDPDIGVASSSLYGRLANADVWAAAAT